MPFLQGFGYTHAHTYTNLINIYAQISIYTRVDWKVHYPNGIWPNEIYFFYIVPLAVHTLLQLVFKCSDPIGPKSHQQQIWHCHINFTAQPSMYTYFHFYVYKKYVWNYIYIYIYIYSDRHSYVNVTILLRKSVSLIYILEGVSHDLLVKKSKRDDVIS